MLNDESRKITCFYLLTQVIQDGQLYSLPVVVEGLYPHMVDLPIFLLQLANLDFNSEEDCYAVRHFEKRVLCS